jgi:ABC-type bacteriocin/lantibiotic exporter with double-glycine peptidase domain
MAQTLLIKQRTNSDCGVAALAMLVGSSYEEVQAAFIEAGLGVRRGRRAPFSSNFADLQRASAVLGLQTRMRRFTTWGCIERMAILKVMRRKNGNWHWVIAERGAHGIVIYDPGSELQSFEHQPMDTEMRDFAAYTPAGNILVLA